MATQDLPHYWQAAVGYGSYECEFNKPDAAKQQTSLGRDRGQIFRPAKPLDFFISFLVLIGEIPHCLIGTLSQCKSFA